MKISLIAAMSKNRVIGVNQSLPWNIPEDLKRFRAITKNHVCIMGRKTFDSVGRPLPNRTNIVVTRNPDFSYDGVVVVPSVEAALEKAKTLIKDPNEEVFILGGGEIYRQTIGIADKIYLTVIGRDFDGDTKFPDFDETKFNITFREDHSEPVPFSFIDYTKK